MATKIWAATVATISDKWSVANRWTPSAPVTNDQIIIGNTTQTGAFTVTEDVTLTIASLTMAGNHKSNQTTTLSVTQPAALTVTGPINLGADSFINGTGTLIANGAISGAGTIIASNGGVLDIAGTGSIASGVVLNFDVSTTLASTLKLDLSGGVTSAANIRMNNASQVLEVGPSTNLKISAQETIAKGTLRLSGGTVTDALGIIVGGQGAAGNIVGHGTLAADVSSGGAKATVNSLTASGGMLEVTGAFGQGLGGTLLGVIDFDIRFDTEVRQYRRSGPANRHQQCVADAGDRRAGCSDDDRPGTGHQWHHQNGWRLVDRYVGHDNRHRRDPGW